MEKILVFAREDERFKDRYIYACTVMGYEPVRAYTEADPEDFAGVIMIGGPDVDPALYHEENTASRTLSSVGLVSFPSGASNLRLPCVPAMILTRWPPCGTDQ